MNAPSSPQLLYLVLTALLVLGGGGNQASAATILVGNYDFSDPTLTSSSSDYTSILDWDFAFTTTGGGIAPGGLQTGLGGSTTQTAYLNVINGSTGATTGTITYTGTGSPTNGGTGTDVAVALPTIVAGKDYTLTVALLNRNLTSSSSDELSLQANGVTLSFTTSSYTTPVLTGTWTDETATLTASEIATNGLAGETLGIQLATVETASGTFVQGNFANVRLTDIADVPEPSTWALMGFGTLLLAVRAIRKNRLA